jgi:glycosyltransferase involved in cell wall biosynthesis
MHIVIDARIINSSTGRYVERLLHYLEELDSPHRYTVLVPTKDLRFWQPTKPNFTVISADFKNYSFGEQWGMKRLLDSLKPDLVHFCMPQQPLLYRGAHVTTFHDLNLLRTYNSDKNWLMFHAKQLVGQFAFRVAAQTSRHIIVPTHYTAEDLSDTFHIRPSKITVTYEAADTQPDTLAPYKHPFKEFILYVGQQSDYKNIRRLGDAHRQLLTTHPDLGLILVGKKNAAALANEQYFTEQGYKNILFTDFIEDAQRDWLYTQARAYIFPSLMEGFGLPGLEAMGYGAPVVSSNATCLPEVYGDAALYFDPTDITSMAMTINQVISSDELRRNMIRKGYKQLAKYSWRRMAEQTLAVYEQALATNSSEQ